MLDPHREIQALVDNFVADLSELAKRIAIEQLKAAFDAGTKVTGMKVTATKVAGTKVAGTKVAGTKLARTKVIAPPPVPVPARPSRARRGQREIEALRGKLLATIAEQPGRRAEDINTALGTNTAQIAQPLRRLVVERLVRTEGARRGTRYFVVGSADPQSGRRASVEAAAAAAVAAAASTTSTTSSASAASADEPSG
jgi:hypothetical protein